MRIGLGSFAAALALATLAACSGGDSTSPGGTPVLAAVRLFAPKGTITVGETVQLTASPKDQNGDPFNAAVTWSSSNNAVATVSATGLVSGQAVGIATITAASGSVSSTPLVLNVIAAGGGTYPLTAEVYMPGNIYSPFVTDIARTGTVQFYFPQDADGHNVIFRKGTPGTPADIDILKNTTRTLQFNTVGTFTYDCTVHPGMTGIVVVH
jgi:plastocyanin